MTVCEISGYDPASPAAASTRVVERPRYSFVSAIQRRRFMPGGRLTVTSGRSFQIYE